VLGRSTPQEAVDRSYEAVRAFMQRFEARFSSLNCQELTGVHLGTPEGQAAFRERNQIEHCSDYVGEAARMVVEIVENSAGN
jgi:Putative redox-active protein (C_GCAxxG_C_C)